MKPAKKKAGCPNGMIACGSTATRHRKGICCPPCGLAVRHVGVCMPSEKPAKKKAGTVRVSPVKWKWYGNAAHLIVGNDCRFHMATLVGKYLVSTVGEWLPDSATWHIYAESKGITLAGRGDERRADFLRRVGYIDIGCDRRFETMVFLAGAPCAAKACGCGLPTIDGSELDFGGYNDAGAATRGHMALCKKWSTRAATRGQG